MNLPQHGFATARDLVILCVVLLRAGAIAQNTSAPLPATPEAQLRLGNDYLDKKDYSSAMTWFRKAAEKANAVAENILGGSMKMGGESSKTTRRR